jgi:hypothetical protein
MGMGPQFVTGKCVILLKFVSTKAGPPHKHGNSLLKMFETAVIPVAVADECNGLQLK